jgi:hypothetical protein
MSIEAVGLWLADAGLWILAALLAGLKAAGMFLALGIMYSIAWFLFCALGFVFSKGEVPAMAMPTAGVLGIMTAILHSIVYFIWWR